MKTCKEHNKILDALQRQKHLEDVIKKASLKRNQLTKEWLLPVIGILVEDDEKSPQLTITGLCGRENMVPMCPPLEMSFPFLLSSVV